MLLFSDNFGTYTVGTDMFKYSERMTNLCNEMHLDKSLISFTRGNVIPEKQDLDRSKFNNTFKFVFS